MSYHPCPIKFYIERMEPSCYSTDFLMSVILLVPRNDRDPEVEMSLVCSGDQKTKCVMNKRRREIKYEG